MKRTKIKLGIMAKDNITGFAGMVTAKAEYLWGCMQFELKPTGLDKDGRPQKSIWFDEERIIPDNDYKKVKQTGGPQDSPPERSVD